MASFADLADQLSQLVSASQQQIGFTFELLGILWIVQMVNFILGYRLNILGIWPRKPYGLPGIIFSPFLHGGFEHLFFNSIPFVILVDLVLLAGTPFFMRLTIFIILLSGLGTWLFGRTGVHVGASSLLMGYWGFLLVSAYSQPSVMSIIVAAVCLYYLSSLFLNLFPTDARTSWEGHLIGCLSGVTGAFIL